ncbi:hypothetical protein ElyMa_003613400 [Elysia marginata]|uniref:Uncharacterized protein n=1 Tax=Elysia marginata TaxID=1093978 RepID=A0AAV4ESM7_9GAST|nr:hypothetical protein ElyMa_003613400 [Elysia marginata]
MSRPGVQTWGYDSRAQSPSLSRLVEGMTSLLTDLHLAEERTRGGRKDRWPGVLLDYERIRRLVLSNRELVRKERDMAQHQPPDHGCGRPKSSTDGVRPSAPSTHACADAGVEADAGGDAVRGAVDAWYIPGQEWVCNEANYNAAGSAAACVSHAY